MTDNKLTDEEIEKALECCRKKNCSTCPCYDDDIECGEMLIGHTIDLIKRKKEMVYTLSKDVNDLIAERDKHIAKIDKLENDITVKVQKIYDGGICEFARIIVNDILPKHMYGHEEKAAELAFAIGAKVAEMRGNK